RPHPVGWEAGWATSERSVGRLRRRAPRWRLLLRQIQRRTGLASKDYSDERKAMLAKTARLKALRLAKNAEEQAAVTMPVAKNSAAARPAKKKRPHAPW